MSKAGDRPSARRGVKLLTLAASLVATLLGLEAALRLAGFESASYHSISGFCEHDPDLGWRLVPGQRTVFRGRHFSAVVETSEQGLRDRPYSPWPEPGRRRILVLGDSVAWCWGVEIDRCFTKLLERALADTDVITMGVPGYSTAQELLLYERDGRGFHPDWVLLVFVGNDPVDNVDTRHRPRFRLAGDGLVLTNHPVPRRKSLVRAWLGQHSRLYAQANFGIQVAHELVRSRGEAAPAAPGAFERVAASEAEALALTRALIERLHDRVTADGARLAVAAVDTDARSVTMLRETCAQRGCALLELDPFVHEAAAAGVAIRLAGDPHFSDEGQVVLAEALLATLPLDRDPARSGATSQ
jgi:hypothetical protein